MRSDGDCVCSRDSSRDAGQFAAGDAGVASAPMVEAAGRMEDDSYAGGGQSGDRAFEENLARRLDAELTGNPPKIRTRRSGTAGDGEPYHRIDLFV